MDRNIKALLVDLSGTIHIGHTPILSSVEALRRLRTANIPIRFCSNTSKESTHSLLSMLRSMGFHIQENELFTSLRACSELLRHKGIKRPYLLLSDSALEEFCYAPSDMDAPGDNEYDAVVVGLAPERLTYHHLNTAFRILAHEYRTIPTSARRHDPLPLIAMHKSRYFQESDGLSMGPGGFISALEYALGGDKRAEVVGKPGDTFFRMALQSLKADGIEEHDWTDVAMVGDDIEADLGGGAIEMGLWRVLVQTGKYRQGDENTGPAPNAICASFPAFVDGLLRGL